MSGLERGQRQREGNGKQRSKKSERDEREVEKSSPLGRVTIVEVTEMVVGGLPATKGREGGVIMGDQSSEEGNRSSLLLESDDLSETSDNVVVGEPFGISEPSSFEESSLEWLRKGSEEVRSRGDTKEKRKRERTLARRDGPFELNDSVFARSPTSRRGSREC